MQWGGGGVKEWSGRGIIRVGVGFQWSALTCYTGGTIGVCWFGHGDAEVLLYVVLDNMINTWLNCVKIAF